MRGRIDQSALEEAQDEVLTLRLLTRHLWNALAARTGWEAEALLGHGRFGQALMRAADPAYDAAQTVWDRHRITVVPGRQVLDGQTPGYLARYPGGEVRNITRAQLLMMAGLDDQDQAA